MVCYIILRRGQTSKMCGNRLGISCSVVIRRHCVVRSEGNPKPTGATKLLTGKRLGVMTSRRLNDYPEAH